MSLVLRTPGASFERDLPGYPGVVLHCRQPSADEGRKITRTIVKIADAPDGIYDAARKTFGSVFQRIEGGEFPDGDTLEFQKNDIGHLTQETMDVIHPLIGVLTGVMAEIITLSGEDRKNSR